MTAATIVLLAVVLLISSNTNVMVVSGVHVDTPNGYVVSNLDPSLNSTSYNDEIYDANFLPGFESGLTNTTVSWSSGVGFGNIEYHVGPWAHEETSSIPHLAVGPQCCNFEEVPHTQQFRRVEWGDYYYVRAGMGAPGINVQNYTAVFGGPTTNVGLRTDWDWKLQFALNWGAPLMLNSSNEWGSIGIAVTQYVPSAPGYLVYTLMNLWMDENSSRQLVNSPDGVQRSIVRPNVAVYHPVQITDSGNQTITLDLSPYLEDTLQSLGILTNSGSAPVISYVYLNVEGYNFAWNTTLWSFKIMSPIVTMQIAYGYVLTVGALVAAVVSVTAYAIFRRRIHRVPNSKSPSR